MHPVTQRAILLDMLGVFAQEAIPLVGIGFVFASIPHHIGVAV